VFCEEQCLCHLIAGNKIVCTLLTACNHLTAQVPLADKSKKGNWNQSFVQAVSLWFGCTSHCCWVRNFIVWCFWFRTLLIQHIDTAEAGRSFCQVSANW